MTDINHRRHNRKPVNARYHELAYNNGYPNHNVTEEKEKGIRISTGRTGRTDYLDKSLHGSSKKSEYADFSVSACIPNDFTNGHRGMARNIKGAKKYVNSRFRFREDEQLKKEIRDGVYKENN